MLGSKQVLFSIMSFEDGGDFEMVQDDVTSTSADTSLGVRLAAMHQLGVDPKAALRCNMISTFDMHDIRLLHLKNKLTASFWSC